MEKARIPFGNPEAERMVALISLLQAVTAAANEARSPETAIQTCLDLVCRYLVWPVGHCYRVAPGGRGDLVDTDLWHIERPEVMNRFRELTASTAMPCDAGLPGRVIETGEPVWIADLTSDPNLVRRGSSADVPLRAAFGFPVVVGKETVAVLEFFNEHVTPPDARLLETLPQIGMQLGRAFERERSERALRESEDLYRDLVESSNDMICTHDMSGTILTANPAMARFFGIAREELIGRDLSDFIAAEVRDEFPEYLVRVRNESAVTGLMKVDGAAGETRVIEYFNTRRVDGVSEPIVRGVARDVTDSYLARRGLVGSERRFRLTFERSLAGICHLTLGGEVLDSNDAFARLLDYDSSELLLATCPVLRPVNDDWERIAEEVVTAHTTTLAFDAVVAVISDFELCLVAREGRLVWLLVSLTYMDVEEGAPPVITATCINISHRKHKEQQVTYQAYHDSLTGLPNRFVFQERLTNALGDRRSVSRGLAIMYLDLDGFKAINDFFGHAAGDAVLKEIGRRLLEVLRSSDTAARLGGDEFAIVLHGVEQPEALSRVATKLLEAIRIPIRYDKFDLGVTASIGVALCPRDGTTKEGLIRKADEAMYLVKSAGKDGFRFASESNA